MKRMGARGLGASGRNICYVAYVSLETSAIVQEVQWVVQMRNEVTLGEEGGMCWNIVVKLNTELTSNNSGSDFSEWFASCRQHILILIAFFTLGLLVLFSDDVELGLYI